MPVTYYPGAQNEQWSERDIQADREAAAAWFHALLESIGAPAPNSESRNPPLNTA
jgi:hypothetical protein